MKQHKSAGMDSRGEYASSSLGADDLMLDRELQAELEAWEEASWIDFLRWEASLDDEEGDDTG